MIDKLDALYKFGATQQERNPKFVVTENDNLITIVSIDCIP